MMSLSLKTIYKVGRICVLDEDNENSMIYHLASTRASLRDDPL